MLTVDLPWSKRSAPSALSVSTGGLGIRSAFILASSAFLASAASTHDLQQSILPEFVRSSHDETITTAEAAWSLLSSRSEKPALSHTHSTSNESVSEYYEIMLRSQATTDIDRVKLMAVSSLHSDDWLAAPSITSV